MSSFARVRAICRIDAPPRAKRAGTDSARAGASVAARRDLRIDLIRGLALWMIFLDHTAGNPLNRITYGHLALPDALDIFVFLSGLSCGILYGKLILTRGFVAAQTRALRRAAQLYLAQVLIGLVNVTCVFAFRPLLDSDYFATYDVTLLAQAPLRAVGAMLGLVYTPQMMDILPLYMVLVLATPAAVLLLTRSQSAALALSAGLWLAAAAIPSLTIPSLGLSGEASYDPFSWQLLFCVGLWLARRHYIDGVPFQPRTPLVALCWVIVAAGFVARHAGLFFGDADAYAWTLEPSLARSHIHPARLVNFLASAYLVATYLRADSGLVRSRWTAPLRLCGRHSLEVFSVAAPVSIVATIAVLKYGPTLTLEAIATVAGLAAMIGVASIAERSGARPRLAPMVAAERPLQRARAR